MRRPGRTPPFRTAAGGIVPESVAEVGYCRPGGVDHWVPPETSVAYFNALSAPSKELLWFEHSGHEPFADEPAKFNHAVTDMVRPLVAQ